jgi:hypothetical protein
MYVRVHDVEAAAVRGCDSVGFDGNAVLGSVGAHVDMGAGSETGSAEAQALVVVVAAVEEEESHVQCQCRYQRPYRTGESGGTGKPYQTLNENPWRVASKTKAGKEKIGQEKGGKGGNKEEGHTGARMLPRTRRRPTWAS